jgi:hypothetical protein
VGVLSFLLTLPATPVSAPIKGVIWLAEVIQDKVETELHDPVNVRHELEEIDRAAAAGQLSEEERKAEQQKVLNRMVRPSQPTASVGGQTEQS